LDIANTRNLHNIIYHNQSFNFINYDNNILSNKSKLQNKEYFTLPTGVLTNLSQLNPNTKYIVGTLITGKTPSKTLAQYGGLDCNIGSFPTKIYIPQP
jgi:hypothetical protein